MAGSSFENPVDLRDAAESLLRGEGTRTERRDAAEHRQRILDTARELFAERGVEGVSMHQIAQAAGVGQGTLYRRYSHKGELCIELLQQSFLEFFLGLQEYLQSAAQTTGPMERLDGFLERAAAFIEDRVEYLAVIKNAYGEDKPVHKKDRHDPIFGMIRGVITSLLEEAAERGEIVGVNVEYTADALLSVFSPELYLSQRRERGMSHEEILAGARRIFIEGLKCSSK